MCSSYAIFFGNLDVHIENEILSNNYITYNSRDLKETGSADVAEWSSF
jgi:hypothetical protein